MSDQDLEKIKEILSTHGEKLNTKFKNLDTTIECISELYKLGDIFHVYGRDSIGPASASKFKCYVDKHREDIIKQSKNAAIFLDKKIEGERLSNLYKYTFYGFYIKSILNLMEIGYLKFDDDRYGNIIVFCEKNRHKFIKSDKKYTMCKTIINSAYSLSFIQKTNIKTSYTSNIDPVQLCNHIISNMNPNGTIYMDTDCVVMTDHIINDDIYLIQNIFPNETELIEEAAFFGKKKYIMINNIGQIEHKGFKQNDPILIEEVRNYKIGALI